MATPSGGKIRSKRSLNTRKPYERPRAKSLLSRVSETVKDLITPSWLNNLWTNPNDDDGDGSSRSSTPELPPQTNQMTVDTPNAMPAAIATSTPDINLPRGKEALSFPRRPQETETTPIVQSDVVRDSAKNDEMDDDVVIIDEDRPSTSAGIRNTPLPFRNYADPIGTSTPNEDMGILGGRKVALDKDDASDTSVSTSGCSSLVPHLDKMEHKEKLSKKNLEKLSEMGQSNPLATSSLWTDASGAGPSGLSVSRPQQPIMGAKRPSFNTSYFGSPRLAGELRPKTASPFYPGKTQFGGSSSQRSSLKRGRTSPYEVHLPVKRNVRAKPANINQDSSLGATSSTARKILDTLERMSTPLLDAKKIPLSPAASPYSFRPSSRMSSLRPGSSRVSEPPVSGLKVAQRASIAPNRQPPIASVIDLDKEDRMAFAQGKASPTSTAPPKISTSSLRFGAPSSTSTPAPPMGGASTSSQDKAGGKMKTKGRNTLHYSATNQADDDVLEVPNLPEVALPLSKGLPSFNFGASQQASSLSKTSQQSSQGVAVTSSLQFSQPPSSMSSDTVPKSSAAPSFMFSAPSKSPMTTAAGSKSEADSRSPQFSFSTPIIKQASSAPSDKSSSTKTTFKFSAPRQAPYASARPNSKQASEAKKPSFETPERTRRKDQEDDDVVHIRDMGEEEEEEQSGGIKVAKELKTGSCLEAFGIRPSKNGPIPSSSTMVQAQVSKVSSSPVDNGPLFGSAKPKTGSSPLHNDSTKMSNSIAAKFQQPSSSWECDACMLMNKEEAEKCIACETSRPGKKKASVGGITKGAVSFGTDSKTSPVFNSLASKFAKQSTEWECDMCMLHNKDSADKCVACSTPKPGGAKTNLAGGAKVTQLPNNVLSDRFKSGAGEWECDTCMIINKASVLKCVACETPKPGSQPSLSAPPASSFKFGSSSNTPLSNGAFTFGSSAASSTANTNLNNASSANSSSGAGFKLPTGFNLGQGTKPVTTDFNGTQGSSGFKLPSNFSLAKASEGSTKSTEQKGAPSGGLSIPKSDEKSATKLEVKVPVGSKLGSGSESSSVTGSLKIGDSTSGGLKFGQSDASKSESLSNCIVPSSGFKFGQTSATVGQSLLDKEGPPPNVNIFQTKVTEEDGPPTKKSLAFGAASENGQKKSGAVPQAFKFGASAKTTTNDSTPNAVAQPFQTAAGTLPTSFGSSSQGATSSAGESKPSFTFGSAASSSSSSVPRPAANLAFGSGNKDITTVSSEAKPSFGFSFGAQTTAASSSSQQTASSLSFSSGQASTAPTTQPSFSFGQAAAQSSATTATTTAVAPSFNFGGTSAKETKAEETAKAGNFSFGSQNQNNSQASSGFSFGSSTPAPAPSATKAQATPSFNFGGASAATKAPATTASGGFSFGSTTSATNAFTGSAPAFGGFGATAGSTNPSPSFGASTTAATTSSSSSFTFGSATTKPSNPFGGSTQPFGGQAAGQTPAFGSATPSTGFGAPTASTAANPPAFGSTSGAPANSAPAFGSSANSMTNSTPGFGASSNPQPAFGSGTASSFGNGSANSSAGGFQFGNKQPAPSFQFGGSGSSNAFQFTGNQLNQTPQATPAVAPQPAGGYNFTAAQQPSFHFGGASTPQPGATPFQFQAAAGSTEATSNPFSAAGTPGAQQTRKIKRAVRRTARR